MDKKIKLGIIGLGRLGLEHAKNIHYNIPGAELYAACSVVEKELETAKELFNPPVITKDYNELFSNKNLDGIVISTIRRLTVRLYVKLLKQG